jgi:hypothetical protein
MKITRNATTSVSAILGLPEQDAYTDEVLAACVVKPDGHEKPLGPFAPRDRLFASTRLYSVTTIAKNAKFGGSRTVCVCDDFSRAKEIVETNEGDIWEHSYMLVAIEQFEANTLYGGLRDHHVFWYRWNIENACYEAIETPAPYLNAIGFGIG